jgi:hypothetical protein
MEEKIMNEKIEPGRKTESQKKLSLLVATGQNGHGDVPAVLSHIRALRETR